MRIGSGHLIALAGAGRGGSARISFMFSE